MASDPPPFMRVVSTGVIRVDPALDPVGNLAEDRPCIRCGYELRGVPFRGPCPECGCPVKRSFMGDLLEYSDSGYVADLHRGCVVVLVGAAMSFLVFVAGALIEVALPTVVPAGGGGAFASFSNPSALSRINSIAGLVAVVVRRGGIGSLPVRTRRRSRRTGASSRGGGCGSRWRWNWPRTPSGV